MIFLIEIYQSNLQNEAKSLLDSLQSFNNPIYYSFLLVLVIFVVITIFYRNIYLPLQNKHTLEKENLELKNTRLMALFAELDPDPIIRVNAEGKIIQSNESAKIINDSKKINGTKLKEVLPFFKINVKDYVENDKAVVYTEKLNDKFYSILFRGNSFLKIGQIYFRDITPRIIAEEKLFSSQKQLKNLSNHLQNIMEEERQRFARELHDGIGQNLSFARMNLKKLTTSRRINTIKGNLNKIIESLDSTIAELKEISHRLKPKILDTMGIEPALIALVNKISKDIGINGSVNISGFSKRLNPRLETCIYRIAQESLNNIIKHSNATEFNIQLINNKKIIRIMISDNGIGFDVKQILSRKNPSTGMGLINIQERIINYDGKFKIDSTPYKGTILIVEIPNKKSLWKTKNI